GIDVLEAESRREQYVTQVQSKATTRPHLDIGGHCVKYSIGEPFRNRSRRRNRYHLAVTGDHHATIRQRGQAVGSTRRRIRHFHDFAHEYIVADSDLDAAVLVYLNLSVIAESVGDGVNDFLFFYIRIRRGHITTAVLTERRGRGQACARRGANDIELSLHGIGRSKEVGELGTVD